MAVAVAMDMARPVEGFSAHGIHGQYRDEEADEDGGATVVRQSVRTQSTKPEKRWNTRSNEVK